MQNVRFSSISCVSQHCEHQKGARRKLNSADGKTDRERARARERERAEDTVLHQGPDNQNVVSASLVLQTERAEEILFFLLHFNATLLRAL